MKHILITTIVAVLLVGCGESQQSSPPVEAKPESPTAKAPDISIHKAAFRGNLEAVKQHLAAGADVNAKEDDGGHKEIVELLIAKGANVNAGDGGWTPLHCATWGGHKEITELLIANDADVNAKDDVGGTPLHYAANEGHKEIAESLITNGAYVDAKDKDEFTPLLWLGGGTRKSPNCF